MIALKFNRITAPLCTPFVNIYYNEQFIFLFFRLYWEKGFDIQHWTKTIILVSLMCITGVLAWVIISLNVDPFIRVLTAGFAIIIGYVCVKMLGENTVTAYQRAKVSSIDIVSNDLRISRNLVKARVNSISEDIEVDRR
jgi:hypothetical protein